MTAYLLPALALLLGLVFLSFSADRLILSASTLAKHFGVPMMLIGITVIAFGTSAPELLVSASAALNGADALAVGNGLGSNIINVGVVLGVCALAAPLTAHPRFLNRELPMLLIAGLLCGAMLMDGQLSLANGIVLLIGLVAYIYYLVRSLKQGGDDGEEPEILDIPLWRAAIESLFMLVVLLLSTQAMVWGATSLARELGVSELVIGLSVVALGTSLPELAAALAGVRRGHSDIAFATVIGSNIFNILGVIAMPALLGNGASLPSEVISRDVPAMLLLTALLAVAMYGSRYFNLAQTGASVIHRKFGFGVVLTFAIYLYMLATQLS